MKQNKENNIKWKNDPNYRKDVLRKLEAKYGMNFPKEEFAYIAFNKKQGD